ncbi:hypothetical protein SATRM34S_01250 [Streptomyces atroolivaceus]
MHQQGDLDTVVEPGSGEDPVMSTTRSRTVRRGLPRWPGTSWPCSTEGSSQGYSVRVISTDLRSGKALPGLAREEGCQSLTIHDFRSRPADRWPTRARAGPRQARRMKKCVETGGFVVFAQGAAGLL